MNRFSELGLTRCEGKKGGRRPSLDIFLKKCLGNRIWKINSRLTKPYIRHELYKTKWLIECC